MQENMAIISIDWWARRLGVAYTKDGRIVFPIGWLVNDDQVMYQLSHVFMQYKVDRILVGYPSKETSIQWKIDAFIKELSFVVSPDCTIEKVNEDYSSVQANVYEWVQKKSAGEDSIAAMVILEEYLKKMLKW